MANIITELHLEMSDNWYVSKKLNSVGRVGENTVTKLIIEPTEILDNVTYEIEIADASGSKNVAELTIDGTELYLILTANMLTTSGIMKMQVRGLFTDGSIKKSNIFELKVNRSISATEAYEEYTVSIFDQLVNECRDIIEGAESYAVRAETAAVNAEAYSESASASAESASASVAQINENTYRINDLEAIIGGYQLTDLPTGEIATVTDGTALLMPSLKVGIEPVQDLHGYDHPWAGGAGKNLLEVTATTQTMGGVTFTVNDDGTIIVNGTTTSSLVWFRVNTNITLSGEYILNGCPAGGDVGNGYSLLIEGETVGRAADTGNGATFNNDGKQCILYIRLGASITYNNVVFKPMIRLATETDATFAPYSNICPISGWTAANVTRSGINVWDEEWELGIYNATNGKKVDISTRIRTKNPIYVIPNMVYNKISPTNGFQYLLFYDKNMNFIRAMNSGAGNRTFTVPANAVFMHSYTENESYGTTYNHDMSINYPSTDTSYHAYNGTTYNIQFKDGDNPLTVYGGTLDVVSGLLTVTDAYIKSYNGETLPSTWISDRDVYEAGTTPTTGAQVCYTLATPTTYQLTPTQIRTLVGNNNIWADTGDIIEGKYFRSLV